jgi:Ferredoxin
MSFVPLQREKYTMNTINMEERKTMNRREALKRMGALVTGAAFTATGLSSFTVSKSDKSDEGKKRLVFYFTATGNSLYVARELAGEKGEQLSIPQVLKGDNLTFEADEIGLVFPDYAASAPLIVRDFISKAKLKASYIFSVITFGNFAANVAEWWNDYCKKQGVTLNYANTLLMVDNYLPVFDMNDQVKIDKHIPENLATIKSDLNEHRQFISHLERMNDQMQGWLDRLQAEHFPMEAERLLKLDAAKCIGCETCAAVCPHGNFKLIDNTITFSGSCEYCLACVHICPQKALTLARGERNSNARYRNEHVSVRDIKKSNNQQ